MQNYIVKDGIIIPSNLHPKQISTLEYPFRVEGHEEGDTDEFGWTLISASIYFCDSIDSSKKAFLHFFNVEHEEYFSMTEADITVDKMLLGIDIDLGFHDYDSVFQCILKKRE